MTSNEVAEDKRMDMILEGNPFSILSMLQGAIRHCLWRREPEISDLVAAMRIETAQSSFLADLINSQFSKGYDVALASRVEVEV